MKEMLKEYDLLLKVIEVSIPEPRPEDIAIQLEAIVRDADGFGSHVFWMSIHHLDCRKLKTAFDFAIRDRRDKDIVPMSPEVVERQMQDIWRAFNDDVRDFHQDYRTNLRRSNDRRVRQVKELYERRQQWRKENPDADPSE